MTNNPFKQATKKQAKLRCAIFGISGAGKSFSSLGIATGIVGEGEKIAAIDTEHGTLSKYSDRFAFDVMELTDYTIDSYIQAIKNAQDYGYEVLVIDSMSHAWKKLVEEVEQLAKAKYKGNNFRAWAEGTPIQNKFIEAINTFDGHIITTMRSKIEYAMSNESGKTQITKTGTQAEQGKGIEYEFDLLLNMDLEHNALVEKDRTGKFQDKVITKPGKEFGQQLRAWLDEGVEADFDKLKKEILAATTKEAVQELWTKAKEGGYVLSTKEAERIVALMKQHADKLSS